MITKLILILNKLINLQIFLSIDLDQSVNIHGF